MAPTRSRTRTSSLSNNADSARFRYVLQADLRALAIPSSDASLSIDPVLTNEAPRQLGRLGDYLCAQGLITEATLVAALAEQQRRIQEGRPIALGDLLVGQGQLSTQALLTVLMLQQLDHQSGAMSSAASRLGELLVQTGLISAEQLETALILQAQARQRGEDLRLGQILISAGVLTDTDLASTLAHQQRKRH
jgi:hypothetical protein